MKDCPACGSRLVAAPERAGLLGCNRCGGVWADSAIAKEIVEKLDAEIARLADTAALLAAKRAGGPLPPESNVRCCPECSRSLDRVHTASTNLDVCQSHGTWFDRGELSRVMKILEHERKGQGPEVALEQRLPRRRGPSGDSDLGKDIHRAIAEGGAEFATLALISSSTGFSAPRPATLSDGLAET